MEVGKTWEVRRCKPIREKDCIAAAVVGAVDEVGVRRYVEVEREKGIEHEELKVKRLLDFVEVENKATEELEGMLEDLE